MGVKIAKIRNDGQTIIPSDIIKMLNIKKEDRFAVFSDGETIYLKRILTKELKERFNMLAKPLREAAKKYGITRDDVDREIHAYHKEKRAKE